MVNLQNIKVPCDDCAIDAPENFSSMVQSKSECFKRGWHVHEAATELFPGTKFEGGKQYVAFMDDDLFDEIYKDIK